MPEEETRSDGLAHRGNMGPDRWQPRGWPERWIVPGCGCACLLSQRRALAECEQERDAGKKLTGWSDGRRAAGWR